MCVLNDRKMIDAHVWPCMCRIDHLHFSPKKLGQQFLKEDASGCVYFFEKDQIEFDKCASTNFFLFFLECLFVRILIYLIFFYFKIVHCLDKYFFYGFIQLIIVMDECDMCKVIEMQD